MNIAYPFVAVYERAVWCSVVVVFLSVLSTQRLMCKVFLEVVVGMDKMAVGTGILM